MKGKGADISFPGVPDTWYASSMTTQASPESTTNGSVHLREYGKWHSPSPRVRQMAQSVSESTANGTVRLGWKAMSPETRCSSMIDEGPRLELSDQDQCARVGREGETLQSP